MPFLKRSSQFIRIILTLSVLLSVLSACTDWSDEAVPTIAANALRSTWQPTTRPVEVAREIGKLPARDEALYFATESLADDWMSPLCPLRGAQTPMIFVYEPLLRYDYATDYYKPGFIEAFNLDGHDLQIKAKSDAFWHDGVATSLADIVYTMEWLRRLNVHSLLTTLTIDFIDDQTLSLHIDSSFDMAEALRIFSQVYVVPRHIFGSLETQKSKDHDTALRFDANMIGSGPYRLEMNDEFAVRLALFKADQTLPAFLVFPRYGDDAARLVAMNNDAIDVWYGDQMTALNVTSLQDGEAIYAVLLNATREPFHDPAVREALFLTNDHDAVIGENRASDAWPFLSFHYLGRHESIQEYAAALAETAVDFDPDEAAALLTRSEYALDADGFYALGMADQTLQFIFLNTMRSRQLAAALMDNWRAYGFRMEAVPLAPTEYQRRVHAGEYDLLLDISMADDRKQAVTARINTIFSTLDLKENQEAVSTIAAALAQWEDRNTNHRAKARETVLRTIQSLHVIVPVMTAPAGYLNVQSRFASNEIEAVLGDPSMANPCGPNGMAIIKAIWQARSPGR